MISITLKTVISIQTAIGVEMEICYINILKYMYLEHMEQTFMPSELIVIIV